MTPKQNGYGVIKFKSPNTSQYQPVNAHRLRFMLFNETMDISGMDVSHLCHNRLHMLKDHLSVEPKVFSKVLNDNLFQNEILHLTINAYCRI